jgi:hypothetical protein
MRHMLFSAWRGWWSRLATRWRTRRGPRLSHRNERFGFHQPLIYRPNGGLVWYKGVIENVSLSGALFRGEKPLAPGTLAQISFYLPEADSAVEPAQIFCWARVVRIKLPRVSETRHTLAVKIVRYRAERKTRPDIREVVSGIQGPGPRETLRKAA